jgi:hypothetical protein
MKRMYSIFKKRTPLLLPVLLTAPALYTPTILPVGSAIVMADEAATTSQIANVALPKEAARLDNNALSAGFGRFLHEMAQERGLPAGEKGNAEVLWWSGAAYKTGRSSFTQAALRNALQQGGYTYQEIERSDIRANPFSEEFGLSGEAAQEIFNLSPWDKTTYFQATHADKRQTIMGMWCDKTEQKQLFLALARAGFKETAQSKPLPAVTAANTLLVKDHHNAMKGIAGPKIPTFTKLTRKPGFLRGMVKDAAGKPLAGANIVVQSSAMGGLRTSVETKTNASGLYEIQVPVGVGQVVNADYRVRYNGKSYTLPLRPVDGERDHFNSKQGHIENFVLHTWGVADQDAVENTPQYGSYYYGAHLRVQWFLNEMSEDATIEVTLKPQGPLMDGSAGRTLVFRLPLKGSSERYLNNIPIGRYVMSARIWDNGDALPLRMEKLFSGVEATDTLQINFEAEHTQLASLDSSGIKSFEVLLKP